MTLTLPLKLKIALWTLLPPGAYCSVSQTNLDFYCYYRSEEESLGIQEDEESGSGSKSRVTSARRRKDSYDFMNTVQMFGESLRPNIACYNILFIYTQTRLTWKSLRLNLYLICQILKAFKGWKPPSPVLETRSTLMFQYLEVMVIGLYIHFYAPGLKGPPGASSDRSVRPSVCLSVYVFVCP